MKIQNNVSLYEGVSCEDDVFFGPSMVFTNVYNPRSHVSRKNEYRETLVRKGASIGANATIVCGNTLGEYASSARARWSRATCRRTRGGGRAGAPGRLDVPCGEKLPLLPRVPEGVRVQCARAASDTRVEARGSSRSRFVAAEPRCEAALDADWHRGLVCIMVAQGLEPRTSGM